MSRKRDSLAAYGDVQFVMEKALEIPGLRATFETSGRATHFKQRCNQYRNLLRKLESERLGAIPGQNAQTAFDVLVIRTVNAEGKSDRAGCIVRFDHQNPDFKITTPEGEEINHQFKSILGDSDA